MDDTIKVGDRVRWMGLEGHEGTVTSLVGNRYAMVQYDSNGGEEKDARLTDLTKI